jgi:glycosyltransferase involved in cell wall biosynthesis
MVTKKSPLVSIIMNCFNGEKYLKEAIDSVYEQSYDNWEIVFWDNGSSDNSASIAKSYDKKLKYYYTKNTLPLGKARNLALNEARGDYVAFSDFNDR